MEALSTKARAAILRCLVEGNSVRATGRITGASTTTILGLLAEAGRACSWYQDVTLVNLPCETLQMDEIWSFVGAKEDRKGKTVSEHPGDVWTWTAICSETKVIAGWRVGDRSMETAVDFCADLSGRFQGFMQINTDGHGAYRWAIGSTFGDTVCHAALIKKYGKNSDGREVCTGIRKEAVRGNPDLSKLNTSYVERQNLTIRMSNRRFTRKTNGFSKKVENHCHMLALGFMFYNFCRSHMTLKTTPACAAGIASRIWTLEDVVKMMDNYNAELLRMEYEKAFELKYTALRTEPKFYEPVETPKVPWYLDKDSGGPNPEVRKPGIRYADEFS